MNNGAEKASRDTFREDLITAIKSSPLIYIPHYHYGYVDDVLGEIFPKRIDGDNRVARPIMLLYSDTIYEYDDQRGQVDFYTKCPMQSKFGVSSLLQGLLMHNPAEGKTCKVLEDHSIILLKNVIQVPFGGSGGQSLLENPAIQTALQTFVEKYERGDYDPRTTIIMVSPAPVSYLPMELRDIITVIDIKPPTMNEILERVRTYPVHSDINGEDLEQFQEELSNSLRGLQMFEVERVLRSVFVLASGKYLKQKSIVDALKEKRRIVKKSGIIEVIEANIGLENVGGLDVLKADLQSKALLYRHLNEIQGKKFNLPIPKGVLIIGMPGCGKTMIAKAVANEFKVPLLRLDINRLMGQYVGMSEENLRRALQTAETANPCVLWIDEVEKAFAGAGANGSDSDMLVQRLMGQFLTWMQEHEAAVYIVATANDVMRPEFMRKGRFDEVYFVDFPNLEERKSILRNKMMPYGFLSKKSETIYDFSEFTDDGKENENFNKVATMMVADKDHEKTSDGFQNGFSGAEIESVVNQVMEKVYVEYREKLDKKAPMDALVKIHIKDFEDVIETMRSSVMANQTTSVEEKKNNPAKATNIERIREMQKTYKFKKATK